MAEQILNISFQVFGFINKSDFFKTFEVKNQKFNKYSAQEKQQLYLETKPSFFVDIPKRSCHMLNHEIFDRISSDPDICHGKPCIKGTRIPVYLIVSLVAYGEDTESIIQNYPSITVDDITTAMKYAAKLCEYEAYAI